VHVRAAYVEALPPAGVGVDLQLQVVLASSPLVDVL
jgi:hypothetical protein